MYKFESATLQTRPIIASRIAQGEAIVTRFNTGEVEDRLFFILTAFISFSLCSS